MKVITELLGRVILPVPGEEVVPKEGIFFPDVAAALAVRYHFTVKPDLENLSPEDIRARGFVFRIGKLGEQPITDFTLWDTGLTVTARNTEVAEAFLRDALKFLAESHEFRTDPLASKTMLVLSELLVEFEEVFDGALKHFDVIARSLQATLGRHYGLSNKYQVNGLTLDFSRELLAPPLNSLAIFGLERRLGRPFGENRYFCRAPFRMPDHIQLLTEIETLFKAET
jgi:hypothetical protein